MKNFNINFVLFITLVFWGATVSAKVIVPGMLDDFENGTTNSWVKGPKANSALAPKNIANEDESNRFLEIKSYGEGLVERDAGSRMVFFNKKQWAGDYTNIGSISINMRAESTTEDYLYMRLAIFDTAAFGTYSRYVSSTSQQLKADGKWHLINLSLAAEDLTRFRGDQSATDVLKNVSQLRFLSSKDDVAAWGVDKISATLAVDNIIAVAAVPVPATIWLMLSGMITLFGMRQQKT
jgi:hypothetical protein